MLVETGAVRVSMWVAVVAHHARRRGAHHGGEIIQVAAHIVMLRVLVALQRQGIIAALINHLLSDGTLAVERVCDDDGVLEVKHSQQHGHRCDLVGPDVGTDLAQHQPLLAGPGADHVQRRLVASPVERAAQNLAVDRHNPLGGFAEACP